MKYIKTFEEFVNESSSESSLILKAIKEYNKMTTSLKKKTLKDLAYTIVHMMGFKTSNNNIESTIDILKKLSDKYGNIPETSEMVEPFTYMLESHDVVSEDINESKTASGEEGRVIVEKEFKIDGELVYTIVGLSVKRKTGFTGYINLVKRGTRPAGTSGFAPFASDYENVINIWKSKKPKEEGECDSELKTMIKSIKIS